MLAISERTSLTAVISLISQDQRKTFLDMAQQKGKLTKEEFHSMNNVVTKLYLKDPYVINVVF